MEDSQSGNGGFEPWSTCAVDVEDLRSYVCSGIPAQLWRTSAVVSEDLLISGLTCKQMMSDMQQNTGVLINVLHLLRYKK